VRENHVILELKGITKHFPGVVANNNVFFSVVEGEIHALVGENGAGKSTLMKIAAGIYKADAGEIIVDGKPRNFHSPQDAFACGISAVHQEFMLINSLTVLENIVLGFEPHDRLGFLNVQEAELKIKELNKKYGLNVPLMAIVGTLPVAIQQQVEILKALYKNARILILDEPTAVLTPQEIEDLFKALRSLKALGTTIVFVTHKLNEVLSVADRVTVMRSGVVQGTLPVGEVTEEKLAQMMVGREVVFRIQKVKKDIDRSSPVLDVHNVSLNSAGGYPILKNINMTVFKGEILGVAGVAGNGQTELVEVITGFSRPDSGEISIRGKQFAYISPRKFREDNSYVCQDRRQVGSSPQQSIWENVLIGLQGERRFSTKTGILRRNAIYRYTRDIVKRFDVRTPSIHTPAGSLSGGNLQRLVLGRELAKDPILLVAEDPTRGLDVGATEYVRTQILQFAAEGKSVLLVSQDLNELLMLSDRIIVLFKGEVVGEIPGDEATPELVGLYMLGLKRGEIIEVSI
jgi:ABC-type uncharacterized transport system ATPase subunit